MLKLNTIRFKISVLYVVVLGIILVLYSAILYFNLRFMLYSDLDQELETKANEVAAIIQAYHQDLGPGEKTFISAIRKTIHLEKQGPETDSLNVAEARWLHNIDRYDLRQDYINVLSADGKPIFKSTDLSPQLLPLFLKGFKSLGQKPLSFSDLQFEGKGLRVVHFPYDFENQKRCIIQVASSVKPIIHVLETRLASIAISIPIVLLLASFVGRIFARRILGPVMDITRTAERITHEDLASRVPIKQADEEILYLGNAFNGMISRLEKSFKYISEFSSHVAHELKTPLAIIKGEAQVELKNEQITVEDHHRFVRGISEEVERMIKVVEDLLLVTRLEYESAVMRLVPLDLKQLLQDIYESSKMLTKQKNIQVFMAKLPEKKIEILADEVHLGRLFYNLIDNAIKFSGEEGAVRIETRAEDRFVEVSVIDNGIGIAEDALPKIFEKFFHLDKRKNKAPVGNGLGLSIALSIAKAHHGAIMVRSEPQKGTTFTVRLPVL